MGLSDDSARCLGLRRHQRERAHGELKSMARPSRLSLISTAMALPMCSTGAMASCSGPINSIRRPTGPRMIDLKTGRPVLDPAKMTKADVNVKDICPAAMGAKNHQPVSYDPNTKLFYVASNHICMDYQAFSVKYKGGFPYVGAILNMYPADHGDVRGRLFAFDPDLRRHQVGHQRHVPGLQRPADHRRRRAVHRDAGRMVPRRG